MTLEVADHGYAATTVVAVYRRAGVSSRAFYENFTGVQDCFLAAYDAVVEVLWSRLWGGPEPVRSLPALLDTYLRALSDEPAAARTFLVEVYAAGPEALARRREVHERFVDGVEAILAPAGGLNRADRFAVDSFIGAITFQVTMRVIAGELDELDQLGADLIGVARRMYPALSDEEVPT
jgi:AcrR family transcriptional regulator